MERIRITIHPPSSDEGLLDVSDALQQVIDLLSLYEQAETANASPDESFEWKLVQASANSPLTIVAEARALNPSVDIGPQVRKVKTEVASGLRNLMQGEGPAWWMQRDAVNLARSLFARNQNGIAVTEIDFGDNQLLAIDRAHADVGIRAVTGIDAVDVEAEIRARNAWGEIQGVMVAAGRYRGQAAVQIRTEQYGFVWCRLPAEVRARYGSAHKMEEVWEGKPIGVRGRLIYGNQGKLSWIEANDIREIIAAPKIDLASVLDPDFTTGLNPAEYLRQLHEGTLAS